MALLYTKDFEIDISLCTGYSPVLHGCRGCSLHVRVVGGRLSTYCRNNTGYHCYDTHTHVPVV